MGTKLKVAVAALALSIAGMVGLTSCGGTPGKGCAKGVDALSASLAGAANASDIDAAAVKSSLKACDGPATWKLYAKVDHIGETIGAMGDMNGQALDESTALDFLCSRYDASNSTSTCQGR